jgi:hypothetical protein
MCWATRAANSDTDSAQSEEITGSPIRDRTGRRTPGTAVRDEIQNGDCRQRGDEDRIEVEAFGRSSRGRGAAIDRAIGDARYIRLW